MSKIFSVAILLTLLFASFGAVLYLSDDSEDSNEIIEEKAPELAKWTFMVYLDADNNLESAGIDDLNEMEEAGSTDEVNIVALFDRVDGYDTTNGDWTDWRYYYVDKDPDGSNNEIMSTEIDYPLLTIGEDPNMGDPQTLIDFVTWSMEQYPAENYLLSLWNHGGGIRGVCWDDTDPNDDNLDLPELNYALNEISNSSNANSTIINNTTDNRIDILGYDACLMAGASIHYQVKEYAVNTVSSEATESGDGWPYELICVKLTEEPDILPEVLAEHMVEYYVESYGVDEPWVTQSAFRNLEMEDVYTKLDVFSEVLINCTPEYEALIWDARENTENYDMTKEAPYMPELSGYPMCDIWDFMDELEIHIPHEEALMNAITELKNAISTARIAFGSGTDMPDSHGLSIYFPAEDDPSGERLIPSSYNAELYESTRFADDHLWDDFLREYYLT